MVTIGGQAVVVYGNQAQIIFNGNLYAICRSFKIKPAFNQDEEDVVGSAFPIITTGHFRGTGEMVIMYSTDAFNNSVDFVQLLTPVAGQVGPINTEIDAADVSGVKGTPGTHSRKLLWTGTIWPLDSEFNQVGTNSTMLTITFKFSALPTET